METVLIDNVDICTTYGAYITDGGHMAVFGWPAAKAVDTNDWAEHDFIEADLSAIHLDIKTFVLPMAMKGDMAAYRAFEAFLHNSPTHKLKFVTYDNLQYTVRVNGISGLDFHNGLSTFNVRMTCYSDAYENYTYSAPSSSLAADTRYKLDGTNLSSYGVIVLDGSLGNMLSYGEMKKLLERNIVTQDFGEYDVNPLDTLTAGVWSRSSSAKGNVKKASCTKTLKCLLKSTTIAGAFGNYFALLHDLIKIDPSVEDSTLAARRELTFTPASKKYGCYYKKQTLNHFAVSGSTVWLTFDIGLCITDETTI